MEINTIVLFFIIMAIILLLTLDYNLDQTNKKNHKSF